MAVERLEDMRNALGYAVRSAERAGVDLGDRPWEMTLEEFEEAAREAGRVPILSFMPMYLAERLLDGRDEIWVG